LQSLRTAPGLKKAARSGSVQANRHGPPRPRRAASASDRSSQRQKGLCSASTNAFRQSQPFALDGKRRRSYTPSLTFPRTTDFEPASGERSSSVSSLRSPRSTTGPSEDPNGRRAGWTSPSDAGQGDGRTVRRQNEGSGLYATSRFERAKSWSFLAGECASRTILNDNRSRNRAEWGWASAVRSESRCPRGDQGRWGGPSHDARAWTGEVHASGEGVRPVASRETCFSSPNEG
jgi:hypothetical protein